MYRRWDKSQLPRGPFTFNLDCLTAQGMVAWYPFGVAGGNFHADQCGVTHMNAGSTGAGHTLGLWGDPCVKFVAASSNSIRTASAILSAAPCSISSWFNSTDTTNQQGILGIGNSNGNARLALILRGDAGDSVRAHAHDNSGAGGEGVAPSSYTANNWFLGHARFTSTASRAAAINGAFGSAETSATSTSTFNETGFGSLVVSGPTRQNYFDGLIGESCIWNIAISNDIAARQYDPGFRFELWYPLRSRKWCSFASAPAAALIPALAIQQRSFIGTGVL